MADNMNKHGEPWGLNGKNPDYESRIYADGQIVDTVCNMQASNSPHWRKDRDRIILCINALAGIADEDVVPTVEAGKKATQICATCIHKGQGHDAHPCGFCKDYDCWKKAVKP